MKKIAALLIVAVALWSASAYATTKWTLLQTYTAAPADPDPNVTPPAAAQIFQVPELCGTRSKAPCSGIKLAYDVPAAISANTCDLQLYILNAQADREPADVLGDVWSATVKATAIARHEDMREADIAPASVFVRVTNCSETIDGTNSLKLYIRAY